MLVGPEAPSGCDTLAIEIVVLLSSFWIVPAALGEATAAAHIEHYFVWPVVRPSATTMRKAFEIETRDKLSFWDAMIVSAAFQADVARILSEDLNAGQKIAGILIVNPFA